MDEIVAGSPTKLERVRVAIGEALSAEGLERVKVTVTQGKGGCIKLRGRVKSGARPDGGKGQLILPGQAL